METKMWSLAHLENQNMCKQKRRKKKVAWDQYELVRKKAIGNCQFPIGAYLHSVGQKVKS